MFLKINKKNALHILAVMGVFSSLLQDTYFIYFSCIFPRCSVQSKLSRCLTQTILSLFPLSLFLSLSSSPSLPLSVSLSSLLLTFEKYGACRIFCVSHNGSFVFSKSKSKASSNVSLFYVTTEVAATSWLLMNKYIYLASKPAYTVEL